jgi:hypothetical protein
MRGGRLIATGLAAAAIALMISGCSFIPGLNRDDQDRAACDKLANLPGTATYASSKIDGSFVAKNQALQYFDLVVNQVQPLASMGFGNEIGAWISSGKNYYQAPSVFEQVASAQVFVQRGSSVLARCFQVGVSWASS